MVRCSIAACVLVLALQSPVWANELLLELTIRKLTVKNAGDPNDKEKKAKDCEEVEVAPNYEIPTLFKDVKGKCLASAVIVGQAGKDFEVGVSGTSLKIDLSVKGKVTRSANDNSTSFFDVTTIFKVDPADKTAKVDWKVIASGELHNDGHVLAILRTGTEIYVMTLKNIKK